MTRIVVIGGGPAGYEAALVAAQLGAEVTVVERDGLGGACVLFDCVPSKTFIASSDAMTAFAAADRLGIDAGKLTEIRVDAPAVHSRVQGLALAQSADVGRQLSRAGVQVVAGTARLLPTGAGRRHRVEIVGSEGPAGPVPAAEVIEADIVLVATGATPRALPGAVPDGERILTWRQLYDLPALPDHLVVVGSGVTGAEFAGAYLALGVDVTLVSSRDRVMPGEDSDAALLIEDIFTRRGMTILARSRAAGVRRTPDGVAVELTDGRIVEGSHALLAVGSVPNTTDLGTDDAGVTVGPGQYVTVDRVSRTNVPGIYAAGDVTGVLMLASVAAMQGRIAMWHALGEAVSPLRLQMVSANVFTDPEIATVGIGQSTVDSGRVLARTLKLPLATNARAKMQGITDGFVKLFCRPSSGLVIGGVVVAPRASELILPIALAVENHLSVGQIAHTISIYPSLSGSLTEAARQLMRHEFD